MGLFRFKLTNNGTTDITVSQVVLPLSSVAGIVSTDLTDLRVNDGSVDVSIGGAASIAGATGTITFDADFTLTAGATVNYTVIGDVTGLVNADTLTLALGTANVTLAAGTVGGSAPSNATHIADHAATLGNHASGQITDQLDSAPSKNDVGLFRFQLVNAAGADLAVDQVVVQLSAITGLVTGDLSDLKIFDGTSNVSVGGVPSIAGATGTITFPADFPLPSGATRNYTVLADVASLVVTDSLTLALGTADVTLTAGSLGGTSPANAIHTANYPQVSSSADDSWTLQSSDNGGANIASTTNRTYDWSTSSEHTGLRFPGVYVPQGSTINSATLYVYVNDATNDDPQTKIYGHLTANAPDFTTQPSIYSTTNRPRTSFVTWVGVGIGAGWKAVTVTGPVQEIVSQAGWSSGNALALLVISDSGATGRRAYIRAWDYAPTGSFAPYLVINHTPPTSLVLGNHASGQLTDQLDGGPTQANRSLYRFRLTNTTGADVTVDQIAFQLSAVTGIGSADLTGLRVNDGSTDLTTGGVASIAAGTGTITFDGNWAVPAGSTKDYTLIGHAASLANGDTLTLSIGSGNITLVAGTISGTVSAAATHTADHTVTLASHGSGQVTDQLDGQSPKNDVALFRFRLTSNSSSLVTVDQLVFPLTSVAGIASGDLSDLRVHDGTTDVTTGAAAIAGATGTITFATDFSLPAGATVDYTLYGDVANLVNGDTLTVALGTANVTLGAGTVTGTAPSSASHTADHALPLAQHASGQVADLWNAAASQNDSSRFRFRLTNTTGAAVTVDQLRPCAVLDPRPELG